MLPGSARLGCHARGSADGPVQLVAATPLDQLKEKSIVERIGTGVQEAAVVVQVVQQLVLTQDFDLLFRQTPARGPGSPAGQRDADVIGGKPIC